MIPAAAASGQGYRYVMAEATTNRQVTALISQCYTGLDAFALRAEVLHRLRRILSVDAAFFATVDPVTMLFTSAVAEEPLSQAAPLFLDNEFGHQDVNKFAVLAESMDPVCSLDRATRGHRPASSRYRNIMAPLGLGDELRAALIASKSCWGVICLHREDASHGFDNRDVAVIRQIAPHVAEGLCRAVRIGLAAEPEAGSPGPGIIVLNDEMTVLSMSSEAEYWLAEIDRPDWPRRSALPVAAYAAATKLAWIEKGSAPTHISPAVQLRGRSGRWLSLYASRLQSSSTPMIGIVVEPTPSAQIGSVLLSAYGLTEAQLRVVALVVKGHSTRQIVAELHISANTVQEHLTAAFDKFGVRSRRELVAAVMSGR
jgi:DNA-binding CsgD family transcriptional regulator